MPFCQYAIAVRGSSVWWLVFGVTNVSSSTSAAFLKPASRSPNDHSSGVLPIGSWPCVVLGEICVGPLQFFDGRRRGRLRPASPRLRPSPDVAFEPRVRSARPQADERIDDERQRLPVDVDLLDRVGGGELVDGRDREDRLALIHRLVGERPLALGVRLDALAEVGHDVGRRREVVGGQDAFTPGIASAALASMRVTRACGIGLSSSLRTACPRRGSLRRTSPGPSPSRRDPAST